MDLFVHIPDFISNVREPALLSTTAAYYARRISQSRGGVRSCVRAVSRRTRRSVVRCS